ncbi:hypothetical protein VK70_00910 [Paenibacillus durus ATCC 35681]|uniref:Dextranase n=1 Tax=Paenibacillus durus ATCC 35681 TaxID=1333534 RepID=A0A0F7CKE7_PAEDU|nr:hypothetical protein VK70_00910 [Paenibacillus durus ATCC 35681]
MFAIILAFSGQFSVRAASIGKLITDVNTDKARYTPGSTVIIYANLQNNTNTTISNGTLTVYFKHLGDEVAPPQSQQFNLDAGAASSIAFTWDPPATDYQGYSVEIWAIDASGHILDNMNTAVDVSSTWQKFPRYGYISTFDSQSSDTSYNIAWQLKNYHINAIQFYDWQWKQHVPLAGSADNPSSSWSDIGNRTIYRQTVSDYINAAHSFNAAAINYNLMHGAFSGYEEDGSGVNYQWGLFNDNPPSSQYSNPLPSGWASSALYIFNPANTEWQNYIFNREKEVFSAFPFDGWHIDSLGGGRMYDFHGNPVDMDQTFQGFINNAKASLGKSIVFNSVGNYGQKEAGASNADILYSEMWEGSGQTTYNDLKNSIDSGTLASGGNKATVLAAYMDRNYQENFREFNQGYFNAPGVLLTDATIFASGGAHIELGDGTNMLSLEYFPNKHLIMSDELKKELRNYYDFMVSYQNLLRGGLSNTHNIVYLHDIATSTNATPNTVWTFTKSGNGYDVIHLINLLGVPSNHWRDADATYPVPALQSNVTVKYYYGSGTVNSVSWASPDYDNGKTYTSSFTTGSDDRGNYVTFTVQSLQYWDMIYINKS